MIGVRVGDRGDATLLLVSPARRPGRGRIRTRARPSRLRAIAARKPRDETRPSGGEITKKNSSRAVTTHGCSTLHAERSSMKVYMFIYNTNQRNKNNKVHLGPITIYVHILQDLYNPPDYFGYYVKTAASPELHLTSRGLAMARRPSHTAVLL